jgi:hypothetical protein
VVGGMLTMLMERERVMLGRLEGIGVERVIDSNVFDTRAFTASCEYC